MTGTFYLTSAQVLNLPAIPRLETSFPRQMAVPSQMKAMVVQPDRTIKLSTVPGPKIEDPEQIIVKVHSCAQNPTDAKGIEMGRTRAGLIPGVDFSGIVVEVGSDVTNVKVGDKVSLALSDLDRRLPLSALDLS